MAVNPLIQQALDEEQSGVGGNVNPLIQQALQEQDSSFVEPESEYAWNPEEPISYEGEGALPLALAGFGKGGANVYKNVSNMLGADSAPTIFAGEGDGLFGSLGFGMTDTTDEGIKEADEEYAGILDTTAGSVGEFAGEAATLAIPGLGYAGRVSKLPTATRVLASVAEGATGGAILAGPDNRVEGSLLGGGLGGTMTLGTSMLSRTIKDGLSKMRKPAAEAIEYVTQKTGKRPHLPLSVAGDTGAGGMSAKATAISDIGTQMPSAKGAMEKQMADLNTNFYEADLRKALSFNKGVADRAVKVLQETGDMQAAIESSMMRNGRLPPGILILDDAARKASKGRYTGQQLERAAKDSAGDAPLAEAPFVKEAGNRIEVVPRGDKTPTGASTVFSRDAIRDASSLIGRTVDLLPFVGPFVGSKGFQNFILGNTGAQRALRQAVDTKSARAVQQVLTAIRRGMSAQAGGSSEARTYADEQTQSLRGQ